MHELNENRSSLPRGMRGWKRTTGARGVSCYHIRTYLSPCGHLWQPRIATKGALQETEKKNIKIINFAIWRNDLKKEIVPEIKVEYRQGAGYSVRTKCYPSMNVSLKILYFTYPAPYGYVMTSISGDIAQFFIRSFRHTWWRWAVNLFPR